MPVVEAGSPPVPGRRWPCFLVAPSSPPPFGRASIGHLVPLRSTWKQSEHGQVNNGSLQLHTLMKNTIFKTKAIT